MSKPMMIALAAGACLGMSACDDLRWGGDETTAPDQALPGETTDATQQPADAPDPGQDAETARTASVRTAAIDWDAARRDLASSPVDSGDRTFNIQSGSSAPPVPVLLPSGPVRTASAPGGPQPQFRPLSDGYYAVFPGEDYNLIVNGTNEITDAPAMENRDTGDMAYAETTTGAIVSFSRYGADYMIEFECLSSGAEGNSCVSEDEALAVAEDIVISGTQ